MDKAFQGIGLEKFDRRVPNGEESMTNRADFLIFTFVAGFIEFIGRARQCGYGSIKKPHDFRQVYVGRFASETVATSFSLLATQYTSFFQIEKYTLQEFAGDAACLGNIPDQEFFLRSFGHVNQRMNRVFTFLRKHGES